MRDDEVELTMTLRVRYELGRTAVEDLERLMIAAAEHLLDSEMLTGDTEASIITSTVEVI